ncbi:DUF6308 family protein [Mycobacterium sp. ST-F2]|uniref:DUF6308 family protein n=1 Tax=Mycobacterium sp. ST-F2 TaxID=1490484 RepID=UPI00093CF3D7|nr:DUF6308 family protein [Mycobacterium sp. ST-F2]
MGNKTIAIADHTMSLDAAMARLEHYPSRTPTIYDFPGPGHPTSISVDEIRRTRAVSSRISTHEGDWFIFRAATAPWTSPESTLQEADPGESDGPYDAMEGLYKHFTAAAPKGVGMAKISKVLHLKRPAQFPILDSRLARTYRDPAARAAKTYANRGYRKMYWAAIRLDLLKSGDALAELRQCVREHPSPRVRALHALTDIRLHDMLTW